MNHSHKFTEANLAKVKRLLKILSPIALQINKEHTDLMEDFNTSKRTGQCHVCFGTEDIRIGRSHVPRGETDKKVRYNIVANIKYNFLLENPEAQSTLPYTDSEKKIFGGGIRAWNKISCVSGFHPQLDEALAIIIGWVLFWKNHDIYTITDTLPGGNHFVAEIINKMGGMKQLQLI